MYTELWIKVTSTTEEKHDKRNECEKIALRFLRPMVTMPDHNVVSGNVDGLGQ